MRTAFLGYVRVLLCLQGLYLWFWAFTLWPRGGANPGFLAQLGLALAFALIGLAEIVTAVRLRPGRRWMAVTAIAIESLWALVAAALAYKVVRDWPFDWGLFQLLSLATVLFLVAVVGLLFPSVRAYAGLARR